MRLSYRDGFLGFSLLLAVSAFAQEKKIKPQDLPPAVQKTVVEQTKGGTVRGFNEETENGRTTYELEMIMNGHTKDVQMDSAGAKHEVEEQVEMGALSPEVRKRLLAQAGKGKIMKVESIRKKDKVVAYEAQISTGGKKSKLQVGPEGQPLDHEE
jgi:hypothetical protein